GRYGSPDPFGCELANSCRDVGTSERTHKPAGSRRRTTRAKARLGIAVAAAGNRSYAAGSQRASREYYRGHQPSQREQNPAASDFVVSAIPERERGGGPQSGGHDFVICELWRFQSKSGKAGTKARDCQSIRRRDDPSCARRAGSAFPTGRAGFFQAQGRVKVGARPGTEGSEHPEEE